MRIEQLGEGTPSVAVVAGIHGDEPSGVDAVERLVEAAPPVERPVLLVVVNERAIDAGVRYVDTDLNRAFPGDPSLDAHEEQLAHELSTVLEGCTVLSLHSTQSHPEPFLVGDRVDPLVERLAAELPIESVVDTGEFIQGRLFHSVRTIEAECGLQGTVAAADNALRVSIAYLVAMDVLAKDVADGLANDFGVTPYERMNDEIVPVYQLTQQLEKHHPGDYEVLVDNFEYVNAGQPFAKAGGVTVVADEPFYPVLLSATGYDEIWGYAATHERDIPVSEATTEVR